MTVRSNSGVLNKDGIHLQFSLASSITPSRDELGTTLQYTNTAIHVDSDVSTTWITRYGNQYSPTDTASTTILAYHEASISD